MLSAARRRTDAPHRCAAPTGYVHDGDTPQWAVFNVGDSRVYALGEHGSSW